MNKKIAILAACSILCADIYAQDIPEAPAEYRRPQGYVPEAYPHTLKQMQELNYEKLSAKSALAMKEFRAAIENGKYKPAAESLDSHKVPEWFLDAKFGMFIDWGLWSVAGWDVKKNKGAMYPDWYEYNMYMEDAVKKYHAKNWGEDFKRDNFIPLFTATRYDPDALIDTAKKAGMKYVIPFAKHHSGYCLWNSSYTLRNSANMGPRKDLIKPLVEACRNSGLKFGFYFSVVEWEYPLIQKDGSLKFSHWNKTELLDYDAEFEAKCSGKTPVKDFFEEYSLPQAAEFINMFEPDILWMDGEWKQDVSELKTYDLAAYFYNVNEGKKDVAVNDRYGLYGGKRLRTVRGDFFTSEYGDNAGSISMENFHAWEENRGISQSFGFNWQDSEENIISAKAFIEMFASVVARGGNLLLIVNLDAQGALPEIQKARLEEIGKWLSKNGEAIYSTRPVSPYIDGDVFYTRGKSGRHIYAIVKDPKKGEIALKIQKGSIATVLESGKPVALKFTEDGARAMLDETPEDGLPVVLKITR